MLRQYYPSFYTKWILSIWVEMERILFLDIGGDSILQINPYTNLQN